MLRDNSFTDEPISHFVTPPADPLPTQSHANNFDDIFGSEPSSPTSSGFPVHNPNNEPSDIPRLRSEHSTAGYRDGLGVGKAQTMQAGFDEGYSLGAVIGLRVGSVLGTLEGVCSAVGKLSGEDKEAEGKRSWELLVKAREELKTESVFGREFWGADGIWIFEVKGEEGENVTFVNVADAHPLLAKWEGVVREEAERWGIDLGVMERVEAKRLGDEEILG